MFDKMTIAYVVDVETKDGEEVGLYGKEQAYLYKDVESAREEAKRLELRGYIAAVKAVAMFPVTYD